MPEQMLQGVLLHQPGNRQPGLRIIIQGLLVLAHITDKQPGLQPIAVQEQVKVPPVVQLIETTPGHQIVQEALQVLRSHHLQVAMRIQGHQIVPALRHGAPIPGRLRIPVLHQAGVVIAGHLTVPVPNHTAGLRRAQAHQAEVLIVGPQAAQAHQAKVLIVAHLPQAEVAQVLEVVVQVLEAVVQELGNCNPKFKCHEAIDYFTRAYFAQSYHIFPNSC